MILCVCVLSSLVSTDLFCSSLSYFIHRIHCACLNTGKCVHIRHPWILHRSKSICVNKKIKRNRAHSLCRGVEFFYSSHHVYIYLRCTMNHLICNHLHHTQIRITRNLDKIKDSVVVSAIRFGGGNRRKSAWKREKDRKRESSVEGR